MNRDPVLSRWFRPFIQVGGFVRKELADILRQPRLLVVLVAGPFFILLLFATGYDEESVVLRTVFVAPEGSVYETAIDRYAEELSAYIETVEVTSDVLEGSDQLDDGRADLVVVFPPDPVETVLGGEQAVISVLHEKIDPLQQTAVEISAQVAVLELNATVLQEIFTSGRDRVAPMGDEIDLASRLVAQLSDAVDDADPDAVAEASADLRGALTGIGTVMDLTEAAIDELDGELADEERDAIDELQSAAGEAEQALDEVDAAGGPNELRAAVATVSETVEELAPRAEGVLAIDPRIAIRPFAVQAENLLRVNVNVDDFFAPSAIGLLLQHLAITFAALALVRDESLGLFESFRVGPIASRHVLLGKYLAYLVVGGVVAAALIASVVSALDIPMRGSLVSLGVAVALLLTASIGLGLVLSVIAQTSTQAIQFAMLALLAGLFFGGFLVSAEAFSYPIRLVCWTLPVTYAIRWFQDVMLRGTTASNADIMGLVGTTIAYGGAAWFLLARKFQVR